MEVERVRARNLACDYSAVTLACYVASNSAEGCICLHYEECDSMVSRLGATGQICRQSLLWERLLCLSQNGIDILPKHRRFLCLLTQRTCRRQPIQAIYMRSD